jgi:glycogen debranching enzyme
MSEEFIRILDGNTFAVSDDRGDFDVSSTFPTGLFWFDTRFLSTWSLTVNRESLHPLAVDDLQYYETRFFLVPGVPAQYADFGVTVVRHRGIGAEWMTEHLVVLNHAHHPVDLVMRLEIGSDFADAFEIKGGQVKKLGRYSAQVQDQCLRLGYQRETFRRETVITSSTLGEVDEMGMLFRVHLDAQGRWATDLRVEMLGAGGTSVRTSLTGRPTRERPQMQADLEDWLARAPRLSSGSDSLLATYRRSLVDLAALRYVPLTSPGERSMPAAGLPWFMTVFGRDSIFTSLQALPFTPELGSTTLSVLGVLQGTHLDDFRDCEPGKILHEIRYGESAGFEEQPHTPYYGSADVTPLYVILLDEYERWTGDAHLVRELERVARAALEWIGEYGDILGNGYIWYQRRNTETGLENQCWKDSPNSISYHDGRLPGLPRATCELQGYAYDAKIRGARLAREFWNDPGYAERLEREAADLRQRFNRDFWIESRQCYALALDADGGQVDALSSNIGHLLWSGIVDDSRAGAVAGHLLGPELFSGWGVRTLAAGEGLYNPIGYHVGTVWPFDNSFIAWGLRRYGFDEEAARIAAGILDAAQFFNGRLPEAFGGYGREVTKYPVQYPTACSPQAWSTGAVFLLLRTMLGMAPEGNHLVVEPAVPAGIDWIELLDIPGRWGKADALGRRREVRQIPGMR